MSMQSKYDVIIIGAGMAGLAAAVKLSETDKNILIIEAKKIPGGRFFSVIDQHIAEIIDNGQHLMMGAYRNTLDLFKITGIDNITIDKKLNIPFYGFDGRTYRIRAPFPGKIGMIAALKKIPGAAYSDIMNILRMLTDLSSDDGMNSEEWLKKYNQTGNIYKFFWKPLILATLNAEPDRAASILLKTVLKKAFFGKSSDMALIYPNREFSFYSNKIIEYLRRKNVDIIFGEKAISIKNNILTTSSREIGFKNIISTVQPYHLRKVLNADQIKKAGISNALDMEYSPILSAYLWFDKEFFSGKIAGLPDGKLQWIFNRRRIQEGIAGKYPGRYAVTISSAEEFRNMKNIDLTNIIVNELHKTFPQSREAKLIHIKILRDNHATSMLSADANQKRPNNKTNLTWLFLAGDWVNTGLPATIESAVTSGYNAFSHIVNK